VAITDLAIAVGTACNCWTGNTKSKKEQRRKCGLHEIAPLNARLPATLANRAQQRKSLACGLYFRSCQQSVSGRLEELIRIDPLLGKQKNGDISICPKGRQLRPQTPPITLPRSRHQDHSGGTRGMPYSDA